MPNEAKLTNEEAIEIATKNGATYIAVQGTPDNKKVADMIADDCDANVAHEELSCRLRFSLLPENFEF